MDLQLRHWTDADAPALSAAIAESLEHLRPWMAWAADEPLSDAARRAWIRLVERERLAGGDRLFGMWLGDRVVGGCGLHRRIGPGGLELGYWVRATDLRRGIATEGVRRLCALAFAEPSVGRVEIHHDRANAASGRVAAAAGFRLTGEHTDGVSAPAEEGIERIWRRDRS